MTTKRRRRTKKKYVPRSTLPKFKVSGTTVLKRNGRHYEVWTICKDASVAQKFLHP